MLLNVEWSSLWLFLIRNVGKCWGVVLGKDFELFFPRQRALAFSCSQLRFLFPRSCPTTPSPTMINGSSLSMARWNISQEGEEEKVYKMKNLSFLVTRERCLSWDQHKQRTQEVHTLNFLFDLFFPITWQLPRMWPNFESWKGLDLVFLGHW